MLARRLPRTSDPVDPPAAFREPAMNPRIAEIFAQLQHLEDDLEQELAKGRLLRGFSVKGGRVRFESEVRRAHRRVRLGLIQFFREMRPFNLLTAPLIYSMIFPIALFDLWATIFQQVYFRAYRIPRVKRSEYVVLDRQHLKYLNVIEIVNCLYCGYANGVIAYGREVAGRTEQYWCPIKHALRIRDPHSRYYQFVDYGDADGYRSKLAEFRRQLQEL
jgi:hypothetical protein